MGIAAAAIGVAVVARGAEEMPRYRLEPGMELTYRGSETFRHQSGIHRSDLETTAWVVRRNADGSVRVIVRQGSRFTSAASIGATLKGFLRGTPKVPLAYDVGHLDLFPDGRLGPDSHPGYRISPASLFPRLPDDEAGAKAGWSGREETLGQDHRYSRLRAEPGGWAFEAERGGSEKAVYGMTADSTFHLDSARGAIRRVETALAQEHGFKGKGTGAMELTGVTTHDPAWLAAFAPAADRFLAATRAYDRAIEEADQAAGEAATSLAAAKAALRSARDGIDHPIFREELDRTLKAHDGMVSNRVDSAKRRAEVVGKPAADWELRGLDGTTRTLAGLRGKVVVLDFWYRGCGWCIKAMPQLNALTARFEGRPVVVLGMNTDTEEADARFVADAMGLKYATLLRAEALPEKYAVQAFPTVIVIDPRGVVREVHVGYSASLQAELAKQIEALLPPE